MQSVQGVAHPTKLLLHSKEMFVTPQKICIIGKSESYKYSQDIDQNWNNVFQIIN